MVNIKFINLSAKEYIITGEYDLCISLMLKNEDLILKRGMDKSEMDEHIKLSSYLKIACYYKSES